MKDDDDRLERLEKEAMLVHNRLLALERIREELSQIRNGFYANIRALEQRIEPIEHRIDELEVLPTHSAKFERSVKNLQSCLHSMAKQLAPK